MLNPDKQGTVQVENRPRQEFLDGARGMAASYVVLHHMWLTTYPNYPTYDGPGVFKSLAFGQIAVAIFIVISGFSLSLAPARTEWRLKNGFVNYLNRRAWRILPTYWAALALSCIIYGLITPQDTGNQ